MSHDPFLEAQSDLLALLQQCRPLLQSYLRIRSSASSASSPELVEARQELESTLTDLGTDLQDLVDSVRAVEGDPGRYGLTIAEVIRRQKLVEDVAAEVEDMHQQLNQTVSAANRRRSDSLAHPDKFYDEDPLTGGGDDGYEEWEEQRQMEIMHEQDEALDGVFQTVGNLRAQADTMGRELEEQAELLEDTDNIADRVGGKLTKGLKGIRYVIEKNEGSHPLLQQTPLTVNPFIDLPKPPTLPHNYASLPSTLPQSSINATPSASAPDLPAYVTSTSGYAAHPSVIIAQNVALREQLSTQAQQATEQIERWELGIRDRELAEKRRKAPGWLDTEDRILEPEKAKSDNETAGNSRAGINLMDEITLQDNASSSRGDQDVDDLGDAMDRAFGRSEKS